MVSALETTENPQGKYLQVQDSAHPGIIHYYYCQECRSIPIAVKAKIASVKASHICKGFIPTYSAELIP